jgi:uncharacterized protein (UPF0276 family)
MKLAKGPTSSNLVGVGLRSPHISYILKNHRKVSQKIGWFEVHSENYYNIGNSAFETLLEVRKNFPISFHSVGNSLGSAQKIDLNHLKKLKEVIDIVNPFLVSDHISWGMVDGKHTNDLLPLPYSKDSLQALSDNVSLMQDFLKREILIENPSTYLSFSKSEISEADFINRVCKKTGCSLLLDVNNIYVSSQNNAKFDPIKYIEELNKKIVKEIHLAGHSKSRIFDGKTYKQILIDTHNDLVCKEVWQLYKHAVKTLGKIPTLLEWDQDIPEFSVFVSEANRARKIIYGK